MVTRLRPQLEGVTAQDAWSRAAEASQRLIADRLDLAKLEAKALISHGAGNVALAAAGGLLALGGYVACMIALVLWIDWWLVAPAAVAVVAAPHLVLGIALLLIAKRRQGQEVLRDREELLPTPRNTPHMHGGARGSYRDD